MDGIYKQAQRRIVCVSESTNIGKYFTKNIHLFIFKELDCFWNKD